MGETPWTPGPWMLDGMNRGHEYWLVGSPMKRIAYVHQSDADARLITAAPEMAEFIRDIAEMRAWDPITRARCECEDP